LTTHVRFDDEAMEMATAYALGQLDVTSASEYESHLSACRICRTEVALLRHATTAMLYAVPQKSPPAGLGDRLMQRIARGGADVLERSDDAVWTAMPVPGVSRRVLFTDFENNRETFIMKMDAGATFPKHRHDAVEECYVIDGDVRDGELSMAAGDFVRYGAGTKHGPLGTTSGCLLLITTSIHEYA
jgi:anti-sigma factor ChrR (cupin superfamily)